MKEREREREGGEKSRVGGFVFGKKPKDNVSKEID